jgi:hypothetical protein
MRPAMQFARLQGPAGLRPMTSGDGPTTLTLGGPRHRLLQPPECHAFRTANGRPSTTSIPAADELCSGMHRLSPWLLLGLPVVALGCSSDCFRQTVAPSDPTLTPFEDGRSSFSLCDPCGPWEGGFDIPVGSPATGCQVIITHQSRDTSGACYYGPTARASQGGRSGEIDDIPVSFTFCSDHCPAQDLASCWLTASASGTDELLCSYGHSICD